jgi:hypothetical protein
MILLLPLLAQLPSPPRGTAKRRSIIPTLTAAEDPESEKHKQDSLDKQRKGQGQWKPELASDSEEAIKADRDNTTPQELADKTKGAAGKGAKA